MFSRLALVTTAQLETHHTLTTTVSMTLSPSLWPWSNRKLIVNYAGCTHLFPGCINTDSLNWPRAVIEDNATFNRLSMVVQLYETMVKVI